MKIKNRKEVLQEFLNDEIEEITPGLYKWRGIYYQVLGRSRVIKLHNWSQFIQISDKYLMREMSKDMIKKYYPLHGQH